MLSGEPFFDPHQTNYYTPRPHQPQQSFRIATKTYLRVLSLFDGIGTGIHILKKLGFVIQKYIASEISEDAITVVQVHHPEVIQVGDIEKREDIKLKTRAMLSDSNSPRFSSCLC